ncbi:MAG: hypothetical protein OXH28_07260 [bacterium]|nr:hypothetical protein [bacterium]
MTDTLMDAEQFVGVTGIQSFPVVWSESFDPAALLGVFSHPSWVLLSRSGEVVERGVGGIDADSLLERAASI